MMSSRDAAPNPRADTPWPAQGLESVPVCPLCGQTERALLYPQLFDNTFGSAPGRWRMFRCICGVAYLDPRPSAATLHLAYETYYTHAPQAPSLTVDAAGRGTLFRLLTLLRNDYLRRRFNVRVPAYTPLGHLAFAALPGRRRRIARRFRHAAIPRADACLLDIGCGNGDFLAEAAAVGWQVSGIDTDPMAVQAVQARGLPAALGSLPATQLPSAAYDFVTLSHVIEHVPDPKAAVAEAYRLLKPGGKLWMATPNIEGAAHRRYREHWRGLEPPRHLALFAKRHLVALCVGAGFARVDAPAVPAETRWMFCQSDAIARGHWRPDDSLRLAPLPRMAARAVEMLATAAPRLAEELVVIAEK